MSANSQQLKGRRVCAAAVYGYVVAASAPAERIVITVYEPDLARWEPGLKRENHEMPYLQTRRNSAWHCYGHFTA
jgi:hypothetical protein